MYCGKCGNEIKNNNAAFCPKCGTEVNRPRSEAPADEKRVQAFPAGNKSKKKKKKNKKGIKAFLITFISLILVLTVTVSCVFCFTPIKSKLMLAVYNTFAERESISFVALYDNEYTYKGKIVFGKDFNSSMGEVKINGNDEESICCIYDGSVFVNYNNALSVLVDTKSYSKNQKNESNASNDESWADKLGDRISKGITEKVYALLDYFIDFDSLPSRAQLAAAADDYLNNYLTDDVFTVEDTEYKNSCMNYTVSVDVKKFKSQTIDFLNKSEDLKDFTASKSGQRLYERVQNIDTDKKVKFTASVDNAVNPVLVGFNLSADGSSVLQIQLFDFDTSSYSEKDFVSSSSKTAKYHKNIYGPDDLTIKSFFRNDNDSQNVGSNTM